MQNNRFISKDYSVFHTCLKKTLRYSRYQIYEGGKRGLIFKHYLIFLDYLE